MQLTTTATAAALSPAARIVEIARSLGACDHDACAGTPRNPDRNLHCPLCGGNGFWIGERTDGRDQPTGEIVLHNLCAAQCDAWGVGRALLPHLDAAGIDPGRLWDAIETIDRRRSGDNRPALPFRSAYEFAQDTPPELTMLIEGLIAHGTMTEFLAAPKAGKTTLLMAAIAAILNDRDFLGRRTRRCPVFYFTEENPATFREALRRAGLLDARDLFVINKRQTAGATLDSLIPRAMAFARRFPEPGLIVVDTLAKFAGFEDDEENTSGAARVALEPLEAAAAAGFAVLYTRHDRKGGGSLVEAGRGSSTFAGTADVLLGLRRTEGRGASNRRTLSGIGRIDGLPEHMVIEYAEGEYRVVGEGPAAVTEDVTSRVLGLLTSEPTTIKALREALPGTTRTTLQRALESLVASEQAVEVGGLGLNRQAKGYTCPPKDQ